MQPTADQLWDALRDVACTTGRKANRIVLLHKSDIEKAILKLCVNEACPPACITADAPSKAPSKIMKSNPNLALREEILKWVKSHLNSADPDIGVWEKTWLVKDEHHLNKLRVMMHDSGAWLIVMSCHAACGAVESEWSGTSLGSVKSVAQLNAIFSAISATET